MFYAKLNNQKKVERYPYTLTDLRIDTPNTSFPEHIDEDTALSFGVVPVKPTTPPKENHKTNLERIAVLQDTEWVEEWVEIPATSEQIKERIAACANDVREKRNCYLADSDWTQLPDASVNAKEWGFYRQKLRDLTLQEGFPWEIIWPETP
jgi:hypothetical protein